MLVESISACFFGILIFDPNQQFCKGYSLCKMAEFQNGVISGIICFFQRFFAQNYFNVLVESIFACFFEF